MTIAADAERAGASVKDHAVAGLKSGAIAMACEDPDSPANFPRNLFIWRSNLFGSSGKGHEYFLRHFLGTRHGLQGKDLGEAGGRKPQEVAWRDPAPEGKLDLVVTLDFRMSTSCLYSDIVPPTATWYEKDDLNTSDMHPFIHPLSAAVIPSGKRAAIGRPTKPSRAASPSLRKVISASSATCARADPARHCRRACSTLRCE